MTDHAHDGPELRERIVGAVHPCSHGTIIVGHMYEPQGASGKCEQDGCGNDAHDPGMVSMSMDHGDESAYMQMLPATALELANRLTRAANLVLETWEDVPDVEREAARFNAS